MSREELIRQRKNVIYILLVVFAVGFFATFFIMDIPNIYFSESYVIKIDGSKNGRGIGLYKKILSQYVEKTTCLDVSDILSNDVYMYASGCDEFHPGIVVEAISIEPGMIKIDSGYGTRFIKSEAIITVRNTSTGERFNIRGAANDVDDTVPYVNVADAMSVMGYGYNLNSFNKTFNVTIN